MSQSDMPAITVATPVTSAEEWDAAVVRPSSGTGTLARLGRVVLLVGSTDPALVEPLVGEAGVVAANGGQGRQLVRSFALMLGTTTTDVPDFVALAPHSSGLAVLVQGDASVTVNGATFSGRDSLAWVERLVPWPVTSLSVQVDSDAAPRAHLHLGTGVVEAGGFELGAASEPLPGTDALVEDVMAPLAPMMKPEPVMEPEPVLEPEPMLEPEPVVEPEPPLPPAPLPVVAPSPPGPDLSKFVAPQARSDEPDQPLPPAYAAPPPYAAAAPPQTPPVFDSVLLDEMDDADDDVPAPLPIVEDDADVADHDHVEQVSGVYCKNRHFNDPRQLFCGVCGINMVQQTPVQISGPRPPLGVIVLDDGAVFQLVSDYYLGRDPGADERVRSGQVRGVPVIDTSHQISRVHARLELRGWDVVLVDNASTNGTFVNPPNTDGWTRLPSGGEHILTQGTRVRIGHRTLAYNTPNGQ